MDPINRRMLDELQRDGRLSLAELARRLHVSPPTVAERLSRLESAGVIRGYHADVDPVAAGYSLSAIIRMRPAPRQLHKVAELVPGDARGRRMPPDHGRGLLPDQGPRPRRDATSRS